MVVKTSLCEYTEFSHSSSTRQTFITGAGTLSLCDIFSSGPVLEPVLMRPKLQLLIICPTVTHKLNGIRGHIRQHADLWSAFSTGTSVFICQYHSTIAATHSFIYHPRCIMFFSLYFSFPLSVSFHHCCYSFIHLPPTLYNVFLPILQFSPVSIIPPLLILIHSTTTHAV